MTGIHHLSLVELAPLADQLDMQYWDSVNGASTWEDHAVKAAHPKPE